MRMRSRMESRMDHILFGQLLKESRGLGGGQRSHGMIRLLKVCKKESQIELAGNKKKNLAAIRVRQPHTQRPQQALEMIWRSLYLLCMHYCCYYLTSRISPSHRPA